MERELKGRIHLKRSLLCILWFILFLIFLFATLPYESLIHWVEYRIEQETEVGLSINGVRFNKDLSILMDSIEIKKEFKNGVLGLTLREVHLKPDLKMLVRGIPAFMFDGKVSKEGRIEGRYKGGEVESLDLHWKEVRMEEIQFPWPKGLPVLSNPTQGEASLNIIKRDRARGSESLNIQLQGLGTSFNEFKLPAFNLSSKEVIYGKVKVSLAP